MKMVFVGGDNKLFGDEVYISDINDVKHLRKVQRIRVGEEIEVFDPVTSKKCLTKIVDVNDDKLVGRVISFTTIKKAKPFIYLLQGLVQKGTFEDEIHKLSELGVDYIIPVIAKYSQNYEINEKYKERLRRICFESAKQVGNPFPSTILDSIDVVRNFDELRKFINSFEGRNKKIIFTWQAINGNEPKNLLDIIHEIKEFDNIFIAVGSEGGFSESEEKSFGDLGFEPVHLGREIFLKSDTVCIGVSFVFRLLRY